MPYDKLLFRETNGNMYYYSERGIMDYFYKRLTENNENWRELLEEYIHFSNDETILSATESIDVIGEIDFGKNGFGSPDGIIIGYKDEKKEKISFLMFIEAKITSYGQSVRNHYSRNDENIYVIVKDGYNSTIKGQIELRYRFLRSLFYHRNRNDGTIAEPQRMIHLYRCYDIKYAEEEYTPRRLNMDGGLKHIRRLLLSAMDRNFKNFFKKTFFICATIENNGINDRKSFVNSYNDVLPKFKDMNNVTDRIGFLDLKKFITDAQQNNAITVVP